MDDRSPCEDLPGADSLGAKPLPPCKPDPRQLYRRERELRTRDSVVAIEEAKAEYTTWLREIKRCGRTAATPANVWCHCGAESVARGLCQTHYFAWWSKATARTEARRRANGGDARVPARANDHCPHRDRPHHAKGCCKSCYTRWFTRRVRAVA